MMDHRTIEAIVLAWCGLGLAYIVANVALALVAYAMGVAQ